MLRVHFFAMPTRQDRSQKENHPFGSGDPWYAFAACVFLFVLYVLLFFFSSVMLRFPSTPSVRPSIHPCIQASIDPPMYPSMHPCVHLFYLFIHPFIHSFVRPCMPGFFAGFFIPSKLLPSLSPSLPAGPRHFKSHRQHNVFLVHLDFKLHQANFHHNPCC